jgi:Uncharacterised protein family (UPF0158)
LPSTVLIKDIVDALEIQFDEAPSFLDLETGKVETVFSEVLHDAGECSAGEEPSLPEWQEPQWEIAQRIAAMDRVLALPTKYDIHEWEIMRDFVNSVESSRIQEELARAIHGRGAFRMFKDTLYRHKIEKAWYAFRAAAWRRIAIAWCEEHGIAWQ